MVEEQEGPDLAAELKALKEALDEERKARKADAEKATRDLMAFASMKSAPSPAPAAGPQAPKPIDYDSLPDPDVDRRAYDRALDRERERFAKETRAYEVAQDEAARPQVDHGKRIYEMVRKQLPDADEEDLRYVAGRVAKEVPGDITTYAAHFGDKLASDIVGAYQSKFGQAGAGKSQEQGEEGNERSESVFGGGMEGPPVAGPGEEVLGSLTGDLKKMQRDAGWAW